MNSQEKPWWRPSPSMVVALFAVFIAMGGTATALSGKFSVKGNDIAPKAVSKSKLADRSVGAHTIRKGVIYSKLIKDRQVGSYKLRLNGNSTVTAEGTTTSQVPVALDGPDATVQVPSGAMIAIQASATMRATGNNKARIDLYEPSLLPNPVQIMSTGSNVFETNYTAPGSGEASGVTGKIRSGWIVFPSSEGKKTFSMRYSTSGGTAIFKDRSLNVTVIR